MAINLLQTESTGAFYSAVRSELKLVHNVLNNAGMIPGKSRLRHNYTVYGGPLGALNFNDFEHMAEVFFTRALSQLNTGNYSMVRIGENRIGIDYKGEIRGIFTNEGKPLAFFKPNHRQLGYATKERELADWRAGKSLFYAA